MGWSPGKGKAEVLNAATDLVQLGDAPGPMRGKTMLIDVSGWGHIASKRGAKQASIISLVTAHAHAAMTVSNFFSMLRAHQGTPHCMQPTSSPSSLTHASIHLPAPLVCQLDCFVVSLCRIPPVTPPGITPTAIAPRNERPHPHRAAPQADAPHRPPDRARQYHTPHQTYTKPTAAPARPASSRAEPTSAPRARTAVLPKLTSPAARHRPYQHHTRQYHTRQHLTRHYLTRQHLTRQHHTCQHHTCQQQANSPHAAKPSPACCRAPH